MSNFLVLIAVNFCFSVPDSHQDQRASSKKHSKSLDKHTETDEIAFLRKRVLPPVVDAYDHQTRGPSYVDHPHLASQQGGDAGDDYEHKKLVK